MLSQPLSTLLFLAGLLLPFVAAPLVLWIGRGRPSWTGLTAAFAALGSFAGLLALTFAHASGQGTVLNWPWIPNLGVSLSFYIDGLSLFFGLLVTGIGVLVLMYGHFYMQGHYDHLGRFFSYLLFFMGAMLGTVFASDFILLFVFWELTGIASFLLIGFLHDKEGARRGATMALVVTGGTGLAMLLGFVLLRQVTGLDSMHALLSSAPVGEQSRLLPLALALLFLGAFGKSAQFPFHFWLPNAMTAPTPVSAYLHSATMVNLGIFLVARIFPAFHGENLWVNALVPIGFTTMGLTVALALLSNDLKAVLAYTTAAQLGFLMGQYGLGSVGGLSYDTLHILNHSLYKGGLFLLVGIIDHAAGTRNLRDLGGLRNRAPLLALLTILAAADMAGFPFTFGFLSKEVTLASLRTAMNAGVPGSTYGFAVFLFASIGKVALALRIVWNVFFGRIPDPITKNWHAPHPGLFVAPLILGFVSLLLGLIPGIFRSLHPVLYVPGLHATASIELSIWHGITPELLLSMGLLVAGALLFLGAQTLRWRFTIIPKALQFDLAFDALLSGVGRVAKQVTRLTAADAPIFHLAILVSCFCGTVALLGYQFASLDVSGLEHLDPPRVFVSTLISLSVFGVLVLRGWAAQIISLSVAGFMTCFYYVLYRAPDLAMTQLLVESLLLVLMLLLLARFPTAADEKRDSRRFWHRRIPRIVLSMAFGSIMTGLVLWMAPTPEREALQTINRAGDFYLANTQGLAHGDNAVNTILVDFRGFDTFGEITVILIAALGGLGLLMRYRRNPDEFREGALDVPGYGPGPDKVEST